jgi:hypothetical protein
MAKELKQVTGNILEVTPIKTGVAPATNGRPANQWTLYGVKIGTAEGTLDFRTFDAKFLSLVGISGAWDYEEEVRTGTKGQYISRTLVSLTKKGSPDLSAITIELAAINKKLDQLLLAQSGPVDEYEEVPPEAEINADNINF